MMTYQPSDPEWATLPEVYRSNVERYNQIVGPYTKGLRGVDEEMEEKRKEATDELDASLQRSINTLAFNTECFIPSYANNVNVRNVYIQARPSSNKRAKNNILGIDDVAVCGVGGGNGLAVFGSRHAYAQGFDIPFLDKPGGDLANCIVCGVDLVNSYNDFPFPVGVTITLKEEDAE